MPSSHQAAFTVTRWRESYSIDDVDDFLAEIGPLLQDSLPNPELAARISDVRFALARLRPGYDMVEIDDHLEHVMALASQGHPRR